MDGNKPDNDSNIGIIIGVIIFVMIFVFLIIVFIASGISDPVAPEASVSIETGTFLSSCTTTPCNNGLICDGTNFTCKLPSGAQCTLYSDCTTGLICSGLCATGDVGSLNQLCPCNEGYQCTTQINSLNICKGLGGITCATGTDCVSTICNNGVCASGAPNSYPCSTNTNCASGNCSLGFCQNPGVTTGVVGSSCAAPCVVFGTAGASCNSTSQDPLRCECETPNAPGVCVTATRGILSSCSPFSGCASSLICYNSNANLCTGGTGTCICTFPYEDPNVQVPGGSCINGMIFGSQSSCFNGVGLGCDSGGICSTNQCGGGSVMASYQFTSSESINLKTAFPGAVNTSIVPVFPGPIQPIKPYKLFATSNELVDTIYLVDSNQGLLSIQYDTESQIATSWVTNISHSVTTNSGNMTTTKILIDAAYNGIEFLVAYDETITTTDGTSIQNDTLYIGTSLSNLVPFNPQSGSGITGTQYTSSGIPLSINYVDISPPNNVSSGGDTLISINGTIYVREASQNSYNIGIITGGPMNGKQMSGLTGPSRFYFDVTQNALGTGPSVCPSQGPNNPVNCQSYQNISFIGPFSSSTGADTSPLTFDQVLQFSGNIAGIALPLDRFDNVQYKVFDYDIYSPTILEGTGTTGTIGMLGGSIITLASAYNNGVFIDNVVSTSFSGVTTLLPYRISTTSRVVTTANAFYILSIGSCSSNPNPI